MDSSASHDLPPTSPLSTRQLAHALSRVPCPEDGRLPAVLPARSDSAHRLRIRSPIRPPVRLVSPLRPSLRERSLRSQVSSAGRDSRDSTAHCALRDGDADSRASRMIGRFAPGRPWRIGQFSTSRFSRLHGGPPGRGRVGSGSRLIVDRSFVDNWRIYVTLR